MRTLATFLTLKRMASNVVQPEKLIFAPSGSSLSARAPQYLSATLSRASLAPSPFTQFHAWFAAAQTTCHQPETVCFSTCSLPRGTPSSRYVYLKELDARGFVIYSNWATSHKAADVATNPQAALAFWWREVERQVRVEGTVERLSPEESQRYFDLRARGSKIGAWASQQSMVLEGGRPELEDRVWEAGVRFRDTPDGEIPVPAFWGGARIVPRVLEFWQGRESRLHDRFRYTRVEGGEGEGEWRIERLSP